MLNVKDWDFISIREIYFKAKTKNWTEWARRISYLGDPRLWGLLTLILGIYGLIVLDFTYLVLFLTSFFQSYFIYYIIKRSVKRARPFENVEGVVRMDKTGHGYGFPSGHSHHSTIMVGMLWLVFFPNPWFIPILILYNLGIGYSRLMTGCHFPSDVIFGTLEAYLELILYWYLSKQIYMAIYTFFFELIF